MEKLRADGLLRRYNGRIQPDQKFIGLRQVNGIPVPGDVIILEGVSGPDLDRFGFNAVSEESSSGSPSGWQSFLRSLGESRIPRVAGALGLVFLGGAAVLDNTNTAEAAHINPILDSDSGIDNLPNLAEICRKVVASVHVRDFKELNNWAGYQEGEDEPGRPVVGARVQWKVTGENQGPVVITDKEGLAEKEFDPQPCNTENGTRLLPQAEVTTTDGRLALRTISSIEGKSGIGNGMTGGAIVWLQRGEAPTTATATPKKPETPTQTATVPAASPTITPGFNLLKEGVNQTADNVDVLIDGVEKILQKLRGQFEKEKALEERSILKSQIEYLEKTLQELKKQVAESEQKSQIEVTGLKNQVKELQGSNQGLEKQVAESEQKSGNWFKAALAGLGLALAGAGGTLWTRRRHKKETNSLKEQIEAKEKRQQELEAQLASQQQPEEPDDSGTNEPGGPPNVPATP